MILIHFTKMHSLGNDFIILDNRDNKINLKKAEIKKLSNRNFGIGFDQLLVVENPTIDNVDFDYRIYNANGTEVEQCGNGTRCFYKYVTAKGISNKKTITVRTSGGILNITKKDNIILTDMAKPIFNPKDIPFIADSIKNTYKILDYELGVLSMGNPHCVLIVDDIEKPIKEIARKIIASPYFPNGVNVSFLKIENKDEVYLRVYERGVGETLACGSGACAAVVYGIILNKLNSKVIVHLKGGDLSVSWTKGQNVIMGGDANFVFEGHINI